jgi:hypothetical protein
MISSSHILSQLHKFDEIAFGKLRLEDNFLLSVGSNLVDFTRLPCRYTPYKYHAIHILYKHDICTCVYVCTEKEDLPTAIISAGYSGLE